MTVTALLCFASATAAAADPTVEILTPAFGTVTASPTILVTGNTTPGANVAVNGALVLVDSNGSWSVRVALADGMNTIRAEAWDSGGNHSNATVQVEFRDPSAELELDLADALDEINATQGDLNRTQAELAETQSDLADVLAELAELRADLEAAKSDLADTQANLTDSQSELKAVRADAGFSGPAGTALLIGLLGLVLGAIGVALAVLGGRKRPRGDESDANRRD